MGHETPRLVGRRCDVVVIGGSAAGLAAALQLGRQRRRVIVVDAGEPRNAPADHVHGYVGHEGIAPAAWSAIGREEVRSYGVEVVSGRAVGVAADGEGGFEVVLTGNRRLLARRVLAATGLVDVLPEIAGVAERWGRSVIHCPFCHGFEHRDERIVQIVTGPLGLHQARLFFALTRRLTLVVHDGVDAADEELDQLRLAGAEVVHRRVASVDVGVDRAACVVLDDGTRLAADVVVVGTSFAVRDDPVRDLGPAMRDHASGLGQVVAVDPRGETSVAGLYAAGNLVEPGQQVLHAAANGSWVGAMICADLADDDVRSAARHGADIQTTDAQDWDDRYAGGALWSGNPNGTLVAEAGDLVPGRALDVGAGEGADALWLAERGWQVTANDIARHALDRLATEAARRRLEIRLLPTDAAGLDPFGSDRFDLVSVQYAAIPRAPDDRGIQNLLNAVAGGGTLVMVAHDLEPMRAPADTAAHSRTFDPDAYVRVDDVLAAIADHPDWIVECHEQRPRPPGAASSHHVDDVVLRARRLR